MPEAAGSILRVREWSPQNLPGVSGSPPPRAKDAVAPVTSATISATSRIV